VWLEGSTEAVAGEPAGTEAQAGGGPPGEQGLRWLTRLPVLERADGASDWQAAADSVCRRTQARRGMASAGIFPAALGSERLPHGFGRRHVVCGPIKGADRPAVPQRRLAGEQPLLRQGDGLVEPWFKGLPGNGGTGLGQRAPVRALSRGPQATPTSHREARAACGRNAVVPATGDERHEDNDTRCQRECAGTGAVWGAFLGQRLHEVEEQGEPSLIKIDRGRRFWGSSC
jgi:hypothetical protein